MIKCVQFKSSPDSTSALFAIFGLSEKKKKKDLKLHGTFYPQLKYYRNKMYMLEYQEI